MRKLLSIVLTVLLLVVPVVAIAGFTVTWDENVPAPEGYRIFVRWESETYDYTTPFWEGPLPPVEITTFLPPEPAMPAPNMEGVTWNRATSEITVDWNQPANPVATDTAYLVCRAYDGELESADSEEVNIEQSNTNVLQEWEVYYSLTSGGPYTSLGKVDGSSGTRVTQPLTAVPDGERAEVFFVVVAFGEGGTNSPDSAEMSVVVDRRTLNPPTGVTVTAMVPVQ